MKKIGAWLLSSLLFIPGCSVGPAYEANSGLIFVGALMVFYDSEGPLSFQTITPWELPKNSVAIGEVRGNSCQHGLSLPVIYSGTDRVSVSGAAGNGSYKKALHDIQKKYPNIFGLYDVKVDIQQMSILTIYSRSCTMVVAQGFKRQHPDSVSAFRGH